MTTALVIPFPKLVGGLVYITSDPTGFYLYSLAPNTAEPALEAVTDRLEEAIAAGRRCARARGARFLGDTSDDGGVS